MEQATEALAAFVATYGLRVLGAVLILVGGRIVAGLARGAVKRLMSRSHLDPSLIDFFGSLSFVLILVFAVVAAISKFGVQTASFVAVIGAASLAVGFALQGSLANFASGVMIFVFRPFKTGDFIDAAGVAGTVKDIQIFNTLLSTPDNIRIIIPNGKVYGGIIKNFSAHATRRVDLVLGIAYGASIEKAMETALGIIRADSRIHGEPEPMIAVTELADSSVNLVVRVWVDTKEYWPVKFDLTRRIKEAFDADGIEIPFPQRVVHMAGSSKSSDEKGTNQ